MKRLAPVRHVAVGALVVLAAITALVSGGASQPGVSLAAGDNVVVTCPTQPNLTWTTGTHTSVRVACPGASPSASTPTSTPASSPSPTPTITPSATPTVTPPAPTPTPTASATATPTPTPAPTPPSSPGTGVYGPAVQADSKNNWQVGWTSRQRVSFRFRASSSSLTSVAVNQRGGTGYSGGNGGQIRAELFADVAGKPSGPGLGSTTWSPGNAGGDWEKLDRHTFASSVALTPGALYHVVFTNPSPTQTTDYVSLNVLYLYAPTSPRQPAFSDDFAVLTWRGSWTVQADTPVMDLAYADGAHDGNAYFGLIVDYYARVSGSNQARERFTPKADVTVTAASVRVKRISGSSPLTLTLLDGSGTVLATGAVPGTGVPLSTLPTPSNPNHWDGASLAGGRWLRVAFPAVTLRAETTYSLRLSTPADTTYAVIPLREASSTETGGATWASRAFRDGSGQKTSGSSWADLYPYAPVDLQSYFEVAP